MLGQMRSFRHVAPLLRSAKPAYSSIGMQMFTRSVSKCVSPLQSRVLLTHSLMANVCRRQAVRQYSVISEDHKAKLYNYDQVKKLVSEPEKHPNSIIVDVREPVEFKDGSIPGAINVPFKSSPGALDLSEEEFEEHFGFEKPSKEKELIFYCLAGVRSTAAEELANTFGYKHRGNYVGSYEDWVSHENKSN